ncbi:C40 family peptidase [Streptomyces sp. NPDC001889]
MSGRLLRTACTAALVTAAAITAAGSQGPVTAPATAPVARTAPVPVPTPVPAPGAGSGAPTDATAETGEAQAEATAEAGGAGPAAQGLAGTIGRLTALYRQAEDAGLRYTGAARALTAQRAETARLGRELTRVRDALAGSRVEAGRLAREQYQGRSELSSMLRILLSRHPEQALNETHLMERAAAHRLATTARLEKGTARATALARASREALDRERALAARQQRARDTATERLRAVERTLASLTAPELARLTSPAAQRQLTAGPLAGGAYLPTARGARAVRYAVEQIGKPYVWGAEGPEAFDCSGLTSQAWAAAGRPVPRTSQEQWERLPRVPLRSLRPGDLVVYFPGATHVAIYLGDGRVVQAPRPGATVKVSPIAANPVLGAVRPDPDGVPLSAAAHVPPRLPEGATAGPDTGYSAADAPAEAAASAR